MIPIFIITYDRIEVLKKSIQSYRDQIGGALEFIIIDTGSTYPPTIEYLNELEDGGVKVYWGKQIGKPPSLNKINKYIQDYFKTHPASNYVVTDPDILLDNVNSDILEIYSRLLDVLPEIEVVGPMLRIDDIPDYYPLKEQLLSNSRHEKFHAQPRHIISLKKQRVKYIFAKIDTTFGMFRAGSQWRRLQAGIRTFAPYSAKHLDWYIDPQNLTDDQRYYMQSASRVAHWSKWELKIQDAIKSIMDNIEDEFVITSTGTVSREVYNYRDRVKNFYVMGSLGASLGIGLGLALNTKQGVVVIAGDGDILMSLGTLVLMNKLKLKNLRLYIIDNNSYASTGCQPTCSDAVRFRDIAGCETLNVKAEKTSAPRIGLSPQDIKERFYRAVNSI